MALKDLLALVDDKLHEVYSRVTYDASSDRAKLAKRIDDTKAKFLATEPARGRKDYSVANGVVAYRPTLPGGGSLVIEKRDTNYVPSERFADFLDLLKAEVTEGRLDKEIEAAANSAQSGETTATVRQPRAKREPGTGGGRGWSEERRAAFAATIAKRNAAKANG